MLHMQLHLHLRSVGCFVVVVLTWSAPRMARGQADARTFVPFPAEGNYAAHPGLFTAHRQRLVLAADLQLELSPVNLRTASETLPVVRRRDSLHLGAIYRGWPVATFWINWSIHHQVMMLEAPTQWRVGDVRLGSTWPLYATRIVALAAEAWADIPVGGAWASDRMPKVAMGGTAEVHYRWLSALANMVFLIRRPQTPADAQQIVTSQFQLLAAASFGPARRRAFVEFAEARDLNGRDGPREIRAGGTIQTDDIALRLGVGIGLSDGFGTPRARFFIGAAWKTLGPPLRVHDVDPIIATFQEEEEEEKEEREDDRVLSFETESKKVPPRELCPALKPSVYFSEGSASLSRASQLSLRMVSNYLLERPEIYHLLIEGRASREGNTLENWRLSRRRAEAVLQALVDRGVPHLRLSIRALGETSASHSEPSEERRADLCVVRRLDGLDDIPDWNVTPRVPWRTDDEAGRQ